MLADSPKKLNSNLLRLASESPNKGATQQKTLKQSKSMSIMHGTTDDRQHLKV